MKENVSKITNLNELVNFLESTEEFADLINEQLNTDDFFGHDVIEFTKREITPDSEQGKDLVKKGNFIRKIGSKFFDLFKVTFSVSFAGVTLIHFEFPKINKLTDNGK